MRRIIKPLSALGVVAVIGLASAQAAFAADPATQTCDPAHPAQVAITKVVETPHGTTVPKISFTYDVTPVSVDGTAFASGNMPAIGPIKADFAGSAASSATTDKGIDTYRVETANIFNGVNFPHAGQYVYTISENLTTVPVIDANDKHQKLTHSQATYKLTVVVVNDDANGTFVCAVAVDSTLKDDGTKGDGKVDATPGTDGKSYAMTFVSTYVHTGGADDPDNPKPEAETESTLSVSKTVGGDMGSKLEHFGFTITLDVPKMASAPKFYRAYVVEGGKVIDPSGNADKGLIGADTEGNKYQYIQVNPKGSTNFTLKHGQKLVFVDTPVGTSFVVSEVTPGNHEPSYLITADGTVDNKSTKGTVGNALTTTEHFVGEKANKADFTNTRDALVVTGLNTTNAPFVGLLALVVVGLVAYVVVKSRLRVNS